MSESGGALRPLPELRTEIQKIDEQLLELITRRVDVAHRIAATKRAAGLPTLDPQREAVVVRRAATFARDNGIEEEDLRDLFWSLVGLTRRAEISGS
jgi:chorismate mutase